MKSDDKLRNRVIGGKTAPGSQEAREQYKQMLVLLAVQWVGVAVIAGVAVYLSLSWIVLALAIACAIAIPDHRKFLKHLRDNAYPMGH